MNTHVKNWSAVRKESQSKLSRRKLLALLSGGALGSLQASCAPGSTTDSTPETSRDVVGETLHYASLRELARMIESKQISPVELTQMMLDRISAVDGRLKSYATVMADGAQAAARRVEQEVAAGSYRGPLHGVPIAVKDLCYTKGVRTMGGLAVLADFVPDHDATVVSKLEQAGAIILGTLLDELERRELRYGLVSIYPSIPGAKISGPVHLPADRESRPLPGCASPP